jgi:hypothetical protein
MIAPVTTNKQWQMKNWRSWGWQIQSWYCAMEQMKNWHSLKWQMRSWRCRAQHLKSWYWQAKRMKNEHLSTTFPWMSSCVDKHQLMRCSSLSFPIYISKNRCQWMPLLSYREQRIYLYSLVIGLRTENK